MSERTHTSTVQKRTAALRPWQSGVVSGLVGAFVFGVMVDLAFPAPVLEVAIPNMYGIAATPADPAVLAGWFIHVAHGAVIGVGFAAMFELGPFTDAGADLVGTAIVGAVYGIVTWVVLAAVVMPVWLSAVGFPAAPPIPNVNPMSLVGHVVYGVVLGVAYGVLVGE